ncbi:MAG: PQQ-dependent dehydrogenase, methanol/ethanol family [Gammaproteobacteria bacterium]|nr:PQQ-dependent dehydrogenase, methanol/ethanol family [Phycisphaerae bacterium]MBM4239519.1 PQQ-dependent dehydrogenase, methanol/ethanol family [Gammaproteobacteria bacterium]
MRGVFGLVKKFHLVAATALIALVAPFASAQDAPIKTERYTLKVETLASGLSSLWSVALLLATLVGFAGVLLGATGCQSAGGVPSAKMIADDSDGRNWPSFGRTYSERHASPLQQIDRSSVGRLGLAWSMDLPRITNGATVPLAIDGTIYFTVGQSIVHAVEAATGRLLWRHDPEVTKVAKRKLRITWGPRGIGYWEGKIYVGTTDGRLIAIDARTGKQVWSAQTVDPGNELTITGPPRVFNGKVIIGNAGSEFGANRGYVTAYDAATGKQAWRFFIVPGNPADGFENAAMKMAAKTWTGEWWKFGGGGQAWNAMTYDPKYNRVYIGTGNGSPWNRKLRSPGGGDNLFLCSIVALDADTGEYVWHYQTTPGETWDYNSAMDITLATLEVDGKPRPVILHAPKNGFFYVIDRETGKPLSAEKFGKVTWAERVDLATGRPVEAAGARYESAPALVWPSTMGVHNWQPMSFNEQTGLVYIPTLEMASQFDDSGIDASNFRIQSTGLNTGLKMLVGDAPADAGKSALLAWDPVRQRAAWSVPTPGLWNGGTMTTRGGLVFQGQSDGRFNAYDAATGALLWSFDAKMGITGAPITFEHDGRQYVSVVVGWGGSAPAFFGSLAAQHGWQARVHPHRLLTFVLDGRASLPDTPPPAMVKPVDDPAFVVDPAKAEAGGMLFAQRCIVCHGLGAVAAGYAPDLRASPVALDAEAFATVVQRGGLEIAGMPRFEELKTGELEAMRHYLRARARGAP